MFKHSKEFPKLIELGRVGGLRQDQIYFLIALRELEDGCENNEFNVREVQDTGYEEQASSAIESIKSNERRWQRYILEQSYMDYASFFFYLGGPYGRGWHEVMPRVGMVKTMKKLLKELQDEFDRHSEVG